MITKTTTIDEKKICQEILESLDKTYTLVYVDYRDEIPPSVIQECIDKKSVEPLLEQDYWMETRCHYATEALNRILKEKGYDPDQIELFRGTDEYDELRMEIESRDDSNPEEELLRKSEFRAYLRLNSNFDCWLPLWEQGGIQCEGTALAGIMAALSLNPRKVKESAVKKGIKTIGRFPSKPRREGKELVDYDKFITVLCETPNYGNWSFFGKISGEALLKCNFDIAKMNIAKGATAAMFNWWNGAGSLDFCETLRPLKVAELKKRQSPYFDDCRLVIDDKSVKDYGYVPCDVYGGAVSDDTLLEA